MGIETAVGWATAALVVSRVNDRVTTWRGIGRHGPQRESNRIARAVFCRLGPTGGMCALVAIYLAIVVGAYLSQEPRLAVARSIDGLQPPSPSSSSNTRS